MLSHAPRARLLEDFGLRAARRSVAFWSIATDLLSVIAPSVAVALGFRAVFATGFAVSCGVALFLVLGALAWMQLATTGRWIGGRITRSRLLEPQTGLPTARLWRARVAQATAAHDPFDITIPPLYPLGERTPPWAAVLDDEEVLGLLGRDNQWIPVTEPTLLGRRPAMRADLAASATRAVVDFTQSVSRLHALVAPAPEGLRITDLQSANGTSIDGARLPDGVTVVASPGSHVGIGKLDFTVVVSRRSDP